MSVDPEYQRYKKNFPRFPGAQRSIALLQQGNVRGAYLDAVLEDLTDHASSCIAEIIAAFWVIKDRRVRALLLAVLAQTQSEEAYPIFVECLTGAEEDLRMWAAYGLDTLGTQEARRVLWEAQHHQFADGTEAERFRRMLDTVKEWKYRRPGRPA